MSKFLFPFFAAVLLISACGGKHSCSADLQTRERTLARALDSLTFLRNMIPPEQLRTSLETLRAQELVLLDDARHCDFGADLMGKNYWQRGRLKFPSRIESALEEVRSEK